MPIYIYETIPSQKGENPEQFEIQQSIHAEPLQVHPETGVPVRRVITGGIFISNKATNNCDTGASCGCCTD